MTDRTLTRETIRTALGGIAPDWELRGADLATGGFMPVYRLSVETPSGRRECYLKATPEDGEGVALEARLLSILDAHTSVPVPAVYGAVDEADDLPAPLFLMAASPGRTVDRPEQSDLPAEVQAGIARSLGRHLADLHGIDPFDGFGYLRVADDRTLAGERPPSDPDAVAVEDPVADWRERLDRDAGAELDAAADSRFGDVVEAVAPVLRERVEGVDGAGRPALCRVDHSIENLAFDPDSGAVTGLFDWAFAVAAPPEYDLFYAERSLAGGPWLLLPGVPDRRDRIREALLAGYREGSDRAGPVIARLDEHRGIYRLLALVRMAALFEGWFDLKDVGDPQREAAARTLREELSAFR